MTHMFECNLPPYLAHDIEAVTHAQAQYLRDKYLWGKCRTALTTVRTARRSAMLISFALLILGLGQALPVCMIDLGAY